MTIENAFSILQVIGILAGAIWAVGRIKTTTELLGKDIKNLCDSILRLEKAIQSMDRVVADHEKRLVRLEIQSERQ